MKRVIMLATTPGSDRDVNGIALPVVTYKKGEAYEMSDVLADCLLKAGLAKLADEVKPVTAEMSPGQPEKSTPEPKQKAKKQRKNAGAAPENKSAE